jgi:hypothetical protein
LLTTTHSAKEPAMPFSHLPALLSAWLGQIVCVLDRRSAVRLLSLFLDALFARGRRTVASWFRAAGIRDAFRLTYNALWAAGRAAGRGGNPPGGRSDVRPRPAFLAPERLCGFFMLFSLATGGGRVSLPAQFL